MGKKSYGKERKFNKITKDIKDVRVQGATNIAKKALEAYSLIPKESSKKALISLRPTEPLLANIMKKIGILSKKEILKHLEDTKKGINRSSLKLLKNKKSIYTHCHSTTVVDSLVYAKNHGKKFRVFITETRPLYQGRKTARDLRKAGVKVGFFVDSGMHEAIKKSDIVLIGADALLKKGIVNKIGSGLAAEIAHVHKKPFYVFSDSWKFYPRNIRMEFRDFHEVWKKLPKNSKIKVMNPAFEFVPKKYITGIVSEFGISGYDAFLKKARRNG